MITVLCCGTERGRIGLEKAGSCDQKQEEAGSSRRCERGDEGCGIGDG